MHSSPSLPRYQLKCREMGISDAVPAEAAIDAELAKLRQQNAELRAAGADDAAADAGGAPAKAAEVAPDALCLLCKSFKCDDGTGQPITTFITAVMVDELIAAGVNIRYQDDCEKGTALYHSAGWGYTAAVGAIVAADPHPDHIRMTDVR